MKFPTPTAQRVSSNTSVAANRAIALQTVLNIQRAKLRGADAIDARLAELDAEWDIERCLETSAASLTLLGLALGSRVDRRWYLLPGAVGAFLLQHALQGWCPPLPLLRRLGVRTTQEIDEERFALKALRGDFAQLESIPETSAAITAYKSVKS